MYNITYTYVAVLVARNIRDIETLLFVFDLTSYSLIMLVCLLEVNIISFRYLSVVIHVVKEK